VFKGVIHHGNKILFLRGIRLVLKLPLPKINSNHDQLDPGSIRINQPLLRGNKKPAEAGFFKTIPTS
jgi:hypothetical protein